MDFKKATPLRILWWKLSFFFFKNAYVLKAKLFKGDKENV